MLDRTNCFDEKNNFIKLLIKIDMQVLEIKRVFLFVFFHSKQLQQTKIYLRNTWIGCTYGPPYVMFKTKLYYTQVICLLAQISLVIIRHYLKKVFSCI